MPSGLLHRSAPYDTIVIGLGAMGSAACYHLARRGRRVLGLDMHPPGHIRGSSHGSTRMIRMCYYEHPDYVPLLRRAYELWDELSRQAASEEGTIFRRTGGVYMGPAGCEAVEGSRRAAELHGLHHQMLTRSQLAARWPQFRVDDGFTALYEPEAGYLVPEAAVGLHQRLAMEAGAELRFQSRVDGWRSDGSGVTVECPYLSAPSSAKSLIITAGAWAGDACEDETVRVAPTRQVLGWVQPHRPGLFDLGAMPVWAIDAAHLGEGLYYGFPMLNGPHQRPGFKLARHARGAPCSADDPSRLAISLSDEETFRPCLRRWIPDADGPTLSMVTCMYESSPDGHFIIDRHPRHPNVFIAAGFSGHGFKFASVVGEILADLAIEGATPHPIGFLGLARFAQAS